MTVAYVIETKEEGRIWLPGLGKTITVCHNTARFWSQEWLLQHVKYAPGLTLPNPPLEMVLRSVNPSTSRLRYFGNYSLLFLLRANFSEVRWPHIAVYKHSRITISDRWSDYSIVTIKFGVWRRWLCCFSTKWILKARCTSSCEVAIIDRLLNPASFLFASPLQSL